MGKVSEALLYDRYEPDYGDRSYFDDYDEREVELQNAPEVERMNPGAQQAPWEADDEEDDFEDFDDLYD